VGRRDSNNKNHPFGVMPKHFLSPRQFLVWIVFTQTILCFVGKDRDTTILSRSAMEESADSPNADTRQTALRVSIGYIVVCIIFT
jgi:hypothetical protein